LLLGIVIGAAVVAFLRDAARPLGEALRPLARAVVKLGLITAERGREKAAELGEMIEDLAVEVKAEHELESMRRAAPGVDFDFHSRGTDVPPAGGEV
jgi:hypothetical protein